MAKKWFLVDSDMVDVHTIEIGRHIGKERVKIEDAIGFAYNVWAQRSQMVRDLTAAFYVAYMEMGADGKPRLDTAHATYFNKGYEMGGN